MKKFLAALVAVTALAWGAAQAETMRIVVVSHGQAADPFWSVVKNGVDQAAKDMGVNVEYRAPDAFDMVVMSQLIDAAVASQPDGLVVSIPDAEALGDAIRGASASGIPVVSMSCGADVQTASDERLRQVGLMHQLMRRPELGAVGGAIPVFVFFASVAGDGAEPG